MTEEVFFNSLDLERPDLAEVRAAVDRGDWAAARKAFADHIRTRETPRWHIDGRGKASATSGKASQTANDALAHRFTVCGIPHQFGEEIDWAYNPTAEPGSEHALDHEWTWQFSRHSFWPALGSAFRETGDERYAQEFVKEMMHWVEHNPVPEKVDQKPYSRWRTIEAGIRMGGPWPDAFFLGLPSAAFTDEAIVTMVRCMGEHARYLEANPTRNNWLTMEMSGLYTVGALFPEFREAAQWRTSAADRMRKELDAQVYPDGAQKELAPGYHGVALRNFCMILALAKLNSLPLLDGYQASLERMFAFEMCLMTSDRALPPFNDSRESPGAVISVLREGLEYFPQRADFRWLVSDGKEGTPPDHASHAFPYAGFAVQRSGWDENARYLAMDAGPFGAGHQHEDKLSFVITAYGRELLTEGGIYAYDASKWRRYVLGPYAHNIVFVDGLGQQRGGVQETYLTDGPLPYVWQSTDEFDYIRASYGSEHEGFGDGKKWLATHTRRVLFVKNGPATDKTPGDFWVVADTLTPQDADSHRYDSAFHLDAPDAAVDMATQAVQTKYPDGLALGIHPLPVEGLTVAIVKGQEEPFVQGWLPEESATLTGVRPVPTPTFSVEGPGIRHLLYVFYPAPQVPLPAITIAPLQQPQIAPEEGIGADIRIGDSFRCRVGFAIDQAKPWNIDGKEIPGEVFLLKTHS